MCNPSMSGMCHYKRSLMWRLKPIPMSNVLSASRMYQSILNWAKGELSWRKKRKQREGKIVNFIEKLLIAARTNKSLLCVGLDPEPSRFPAQYAGKPVAQSVRDFCLSIIEATAP